MSIPIVYYIQCLNVIRLTKCCNLNMTKTNRNAWRGVYTRPATTLELEKRIHGKVRTYCNTEVCFWHVYQLVFWMPVNNILWYIIYSGCHAGMRWHPQTLYLYWKALYCRKHIDHSHYLDICKLFIRVRVDSGMEMHHVLLYITSCVNVEHSTSL